MVQKKVLLATHEDSFLKKLKMVYRLPILHLPIILKINKKRFLFVLFVEQLFPDSVLWVQKKLFIFARSLKHQKTLFLIFYKCILLHIWKIVLMNRMHFYEIVLEKQSFL